MRFSMFTDVVGYEGLYLVSTNGVVYSIKSDKCLNTVLDRYGYLTVHLSKNGKAIYVKIHRLVAEAFIPNPNNLPEVNHKDENKQNNNVSNLEWCTNQYNQTYGTVCTRRGLSHRGHKHTEETKRVISEKAKERYKIKKKG